MAKRSERRPVQFERDQYGCMWGLISILDFRHGRFTRELLSHRRRGNRNTVDGGSSRNKIEMLTLLDENCQGTGDGEKSTTATADVGKSSVKKLIEEEMISEQDPKVEKSNAEVVQKQSDNGGHLRKNHRRTKKTSKKSCDKRTNGLNAEGNLKSECSCTQNSKQQSTGSFDIDGIMEEFCSQIHQKSIGCVKRDQQGEVLVHSNQRHSDFEEKLSSAIKAFINQKVISGNHLTENGKMQNSEELEDALQVLSSDEELFLKLLQDPNSLLVKHVEHLQGAQVEKDEKSRSLAVPKLSDQELVNRKKHNFFRRKVKSRKMNSSKGNENSQASNTIVILKPGRAGLRNSGTKCSLGSSPESSHIIINKGLGGKVSSRFFLPEIKRRLKHAMGMERNGTSPNGISNRIPSEHQSLGDCSKGAGGENFGRNSPSKEHFYIEKIVRPVERGDKTGKLKDSEISTDHETAAFSEQRVSNLYIEAKRHLSDLLNDGNEDVDSSSRPVPKSLGRILSLPEYNFSPIGSPGGDFEQSFVRGHMRWSPKQENNVSHLAQAVNNLDTASFISDDDAGKQMEETSCSIKDEMSSEGDVEIVKAIDTVAQEESDALVALSEPSGSSIAGDNQNDDTSEVCDEDGHSEHLKQCSIEENHSPSSPLASPLSSSITTKAEDPRIAIDMAERPSPVSVLEPLFTEDDISPANTRSMPVELPVQPLRIQFVECDYSPADQCIRVKTCMDDKESVFEYVEMVLQASGLNWDEFYVKWLSSDQLLDQSLFDETEFFSDQICCDQKLLFDCINEVLVEICCQYFGCSPWVSFAKLSIKPVPNMKKVIREVWEGVYWHLLPQPLPPTLDQIVGKDMAKSGTWMDLRFDIESIGVDTGEAILEELIEDSILSCISESSEIGYTVLTELDEDESSIYL